MKDEELAVSLEDVKAILATATGEEVLEKLGGYFGKQREYRRAVLGVDIYRYSQYTAEKQRLIPILFRLLYDAVLEDLRSREALFFPGSDETYRDQFISTGDGGFQILATPVHALVFATIFETHLQWFNSYVTHESLRSALGPLTVRWAITYDSLFEFESNYFGSAIITNARLLSRDRLNGCLLDGNVVEWFQRVMGSIESLEPRDTAQMCEILGIAKETAGRTVLFQPPQPFRTIIAQKIGETESKGTRLDVHSLFIQARIWHPNATKNDDLRNIVVSLGNPNSQGLA